MLAAAWVALASAVMFVMLPGGMGWPARVCTIGGDLALALTCWSLRRDGTDEQLAHALPVIVQVGILLTGIGSWATGEGLYSPGLALFGVLVCLLTVVHGARRGGEAAASALAILLFFMLAESLGWLQPQLLPTATPVARLLATHVLVLAMALGIGGVLSRVLESTLRNGDDRERRFMGLLAIAADAYWELDNEGLLVRFSAKEDLRVFTGLRGNGTGPDSGLGRPLWLTRGVMFEPAVLETLQSEFAARLRMRDVPMRWVDSAGRVRHFMLSAEPRQSETGKFGGYWGVLRDVTTDVKARQSLWATETRYQDLFRRIPTPLVLHRESRMLDANPAGVKLFGHPDLRAVLGQDLVSMFEPGAVRERVQVRLRRLEGLPIGEGLPEEELTLQVGKPPRRVHIRMSSVRVDVEGEAATLSIIIDETERRAADDLVRRSEALLSHLVATSPDAISLNEIPSGRYTMLNPTFLALTGYRSDEVLGRTSDELGLWRDPAQRDQFYRSIEGEAEGAGEGGGRSSLQSMPSELVTRDGRRLQVLLSAARFKIDGTEYQMTSARDVTAAEQARREREAVLDNALVGIAFTRDQLFQLTNHRFDTMFGWSRGALAGRPQHLVWPSQDAWRDMARELGPALARGEPVDTEREMMRRDGSLFACRLLARALDPSQPGRGGTIWLAEDITQRRAVERALAQARDDAEAANRAKSAFLATTSHEIRTPLNALVGLAQLARSPGLDDARRLQYLEQISESAQVLSVIISDILDLSKIEAGKVSLEHVGFDLRALVHSLGEAYGALADTQGLSLNVHVDDDVPEAVVGDPIRVRQILANYLGNALKFTRHGSIALSLQRGVGHRLRAEVTDTGPGVEPQAQLQLFQPFTQLDNSITRRVGGTGLGLSICRELAQLMGGEVGVISEAGQGSIFWVELPLPAASETESPSRISGHEHDPLSGVRVLMVEDNPVNMMIAVALLERWGVQVDQADDGEAALRMIREASAAGQPFDAVLMDVQMPGMSGHEVTRRLRERWSARELPVVALTAAALASEREEALAAGMNEFLTKPIDAARLHDTLERVLSRG